MSSRLQIRWAYVISNEFHCVEGSLRETRRVKVTNVIEIQFDVTKCWTRRIIRRRVKFIERGINIDRLCGMWK